MAARFDSPGPRLRARTTIVALALASAVLSGSARSAEARERVLHLKLGPFPLPALGEREVCKAVHVENVPGMEVISWVTRARTLRHGEVGSHHFFAYGYYGSDSPLFTNTLVDDPGCNGFGPPDFHTNRVFLGGSEGERLRNGWLETSGGMPPGISLQLPNLTDKPNDAVIVMNSHYFNNSTKPARALVRLTLHLGPRDPNKRPLRQHVSVDGCRGIYVPPGEVHSVSGTWQADGMVTYPAEGGDRNPPGDVCVLFMSPHMHKRGRLFTIEYEQDGQPAQKLITTTDYLHPGIIFWGRGFLLKAYTPENGHPRFRYTCTHANDADGASMKMGCEETPDVRPGISWIDADALGISPKESHARPCGVDGQNCVGFGTGRCVPANLVFGVLSDDDMCLTVSGLYAPRADQPPETACNPFE